MMRRVLAILATFIVLESTIAVEVAGRLVPSLHQ